MDNDIRKLIWDRAKKYYPVKASHGLNHIQDNLNMAKKMLDFAKEQLTDQIYAAIVFHDSGLEKYGREIHEVHSAEIAKRELKDLFNSKDLFLIAAAIREHRASFKGEFTSMLSDICSSADRNAPNFEASVARSFLYTSEHHPEFSFEEKCETVATHLKKKYGSNGYARFPIYYSRYYGKDLTNYKRKMDGLNAAVVEGIVGKNGKNASKIYDASMEEMESIKKITFPPSEIDTIKKQDRIITTRVSADYDKFFVGDLVETPWNVIFKVVKRQEIKDITNHPFYSELTREQINFLSEYNKIAVLTLEKVDGQNTYYRITYSGVGIYEALKKHSSKEDWDAFLKSDAAKWLPKPTCEYKSYYESYFTELGYKTFMDKTKRFMDKVLDKEKIKVSKYVGIDLTRCVYKDKYQVVVDQNTGRVSTESLSNFDDEKKLEMKELPTNPSDKDLQLLLNSTNEAAKASNDELWTLQDLKDKFKRPNRKLCHYFLFHYDNKPIGGAMYMDPDDQCRAFSIGDFAIYKEYRGKGFGSKCFKMLLDKIKKSNSTLPIYLGVHVNNTKAIEFYKKFGFKIAKTMEENGNKFHQMFLGKPIEFKSDEKQNGATESLSDKVASNIVNDKVYHASPKKFDVISGKKSNTPNAKSSVFVSPFKHFASMFILDFQGIVDTIEEQIGKKHIKIDNFGFMEWNETPKLTTTIPSKVHVLVRTPENFKSFKGKATGYLYTIDFTKYKDKADMWSHAQGSDVELIIHGDVYYEKCEQITLEYEVMKDTKQYNHSTEDFSQENLGSKDDVFVKDIIRPKIRDGILYHGSAEKHVPIKAFQLKELRDKKIKTISLTPYKRLASLFCVPFRSIRENEKGQVIFHHAAFKLDEWFVDIPEDDKYKAVQTVHISHNIKELAPSDKVYTGYLHYVDAEDALEDAGRNPINDKGPNEVVCFKSELKPFKVEQIHVRMISRYSSSFAKEVGHDAESCEPEDIASEEFKLDFSVPIKEEFSMEEAIDLLSEFNEGCKAFEDWCNRLEASLIYKSTDDAGVKQVCFSIAQENILNDLVKDIFKKIGEFIRWFWSKLVQLWNFFFGKIQRAQRAFKSNHDKIKAHKNSNKLFNDKAFSAMPSPMGITIADVYLDFLDAYWDPDKCYPAFEAIFNAYEKDPRDLIDLMNDNTATSPLFQMYHAVGYGIVANTVDEAKETAFSKLVKAYPAKGTLKEAGYTDGEIIEVLSDMMTHVIESYAKTSKLINSKGNIGAVAAKKMLDYADRTDLTEQEANQMAAKVNAAASCIKVVVQKFNDSYYQLLSQTLKLQECYMKCMQ